jgi:hypothetical protein
MTSQLSIGRPVTARYVADGDTSESALFYLLRANARHPRALITIAERATVRSARCDLLVAVAYIRLGL